MYVKRVDCDKTKENGAYVVQRAYYTNHIVTFNGTPTFKKLRHSIAYIAFSESVSAFFKISMQVFLFQIADILQFCCYFTVFTALHRKQTLPSDENYVCPSVKRVHRDKTEERCLDFYTIQKLI